MCNNNFSLSVPAFCPFSLPSEVSEYLLRSPVSLQNYVFKMAELFCNWSCTGEMLTKIISLSPNANHTMTLLSRQLLNPLQIKSTLPYYFGNFFSSRCGWLPIGLFQQILLGWGWQSRGVPDHNLLEKKVETELITQMNRLGEIQLLEPRLGVIENCMCLNFSLSVWISTMKNNSMEIGFVNYCRSLGYLCSVWLKDS